MWGLSLRLIVPPPVCLRVETEGRLRSQLQSPDITPGTQTQTQTRGREKKQKNTELELYLENVFIRDTNTHTHTHTQRQHSDDAGHSAWAMPFLWRQLSGHTACRSHRWLPWIITIMNVKATKTHRHKTFFFFFFFFLKAQERIQKNNSDWCLRYIRHVKWTRHLTDVLFHFVLLVVSGLKLLLLMIMMMEKLLEYYIYIVPNLVSPLNCCSITSGHYRTCLRLPCQCFSKCK